MLIASRGCNEGRLGYTEDTKSLVEKGPARIVLNRKLFLEYMKKYIEDYKDVLVASKQRKNAFIRKMNCICETA